MSYSIIIPAWNESACIEQTLAAITTAQADLELSGEIIVVDNNSTDDTATKAKAAGATIVFEPVNQIARARNAGAAASTGAWLIFIDADTVISHELLAATLEAMRTNRVTGGGATVAFDQPLTGLANFLVRFWNWWSVKSRTAAGCYIFTNRKAFESVGRFDEKQFVAEELYLSRNLRNYAKEHGEEFVILTEQPVVSSARKIDWFSPSQILRQILILLLPGASRSRRFCKLWYDRSHLR